LSVIFERMPGGTEEAAHRHQRAQQFFYVLKGRLVIQVGPDAISVASGEGLEILPGVIHQVRNPARAPAEFLVISAPPSHGDREDIAHPTP
jgi:mannose-6-phosphate isomerase-like protein (cupin superfamily)